MRKSLFRSVIVTAAVAIGIAAGSASAVTAQPATAPPDMDFEELMAVLTPDQMACLVSNSMDVDPDDVAAVFAVLEECDIDIADLMAASGGGGVSLGASLADFGIDAIAESCIAASVSVAPPADDAAALGVLQDCGVSLVEVVTLIGGGSSDGPVVSTPAVGTDDNPLVAAIAAELAEEFPKLNQEQLNCFAAAALEDMAAFAAEDATAIFAALDACDIPLTDIL